MALAVLHVGGNVTTVTGGAVTSDSWTSTAGSLLVVIGHTYNTSSAPSNTDVSDSKGNSWVVAGGSSLYSGLGQPGIVMFRNSGGPRGAGHTISYQGPGGPSSNNVAVIEIAGADAIAPYDPTTANVNRQTVGGSPWNVTASGLIVPVQIAVYAVTIDTGTSTSWGNPTGYSNIINQGDGSTKLVTYAGYKIGETGTPTVGATGAFVIGSANEAIATFKEAAGAAADPTLWMIQPIVRGRFA